MVLTRIKSKRWLFGLLLLILLGSNFVVYRLPIMPVPTESIGVVLGSLVDFAIVAPLLILAMTREKGFTMKRFITFMVLGLVATRFIIPAAYFEPFKFVPYVAIGIEGVIVLAEIGLVILLVKHMPDIIGEIRKTSTSSLFAFPEKVKEKVSNHLIISILAAELLMFYYAFASWKQQPNRGDGKFYLHEKTSLISFNVMLIHAIIIETIGIHWWLHDKSLILSIVLLVLNIYSIIFFIADIQAVRLNPLTIDENRIRISLGLLKRIDIPFDAIDRVEWGKRAETYNLKEKGLVDFIARDFEEVKPQCIIHFKRSLKATLFLGMEKECHVVAIRVDELGKFQHALEEKLAN